jgi:hypothetical protein
MMLQHAGRTVQAALALHRHAVGERSVDAVLRWIAEHTGTSVFLYGRSGLLTHAAPRPPAADLAARLEPEVRRATGGEIDAATVDAPGHGIRLISIGTTSPRPVLVVTGARDDLAEAADIAGEAAGLLELIWRMEEAEGRERRMALADHRVREAVLHLLMAGNVGAARRAAGALRPTLTDPIEVHLVSGPPAIRGALAKRCDAICAERAWIVRCPVYSGHLIVLAPAGKRLGEAFAAMVGADSRCRLGSSRVVALRDVASGYEQALHALTRSVASTDRTASYEPGRDLVQLLGDDAHGWAAGVLEPLLAFRTSRRNEPDAEDLLTTLRSWLYFQGAATRQLKVHRNTLAGRLKLIETLLRTDLGEVGVQATLQLAVRVHGGSPAALPAGRADLDTVLDTGPVREWAEREVQPLRAAGSEQAIQTLQVWLGHGTRLAQTADVLGVSVVAARKRLVRLEQTLGRTLLNAPPNRNDLWLALRVAKLLPVE